MLNIAGVSTIQGSRILVPIHYSKKVFGFYVQRLSDLSSRALEMRVKALSNFIVKERSFCPGLCIDRFFCLRVNPIVMLITYSWERTQYLRKVGFIK
jgi:hypothetical protein